MKKEDLLDELNRIGRIVGFMKRDSDEDTRYLGDLQLRIDELYRKVEEKEWQ